MNSTARLTLAVLFSSPRLCTESGRAPGAPQPARTFKSLKKEGYERPRGPTCVGMVVATSLVMGRSRHGGEGQMRQIADEFMKLLAVIMVLVTLAVSTAAFSMMFG